MSTFDIILLVILGGFGLFGLWFGLVHTLGSLIGTAFGVFLAIRFYEVVAQWLINITGWGENICKVVVFIVMFFIINRLMGLAFWLVERVLRIFTGLPFIRSIDRLFGLIFGLLEGGLVLGFIFYFIARFPVGDWFMGLVSGSKVVPYAVKLANILMPLVPEAIKVLKSTVEGII